MSHQLRVGIDARIPDGQFGGVQQWVIGLAAALSRLDDASDEYLFLVNEGDHAWLDPFVSGPCSLLTRPPRRGDRLQRVASKAGRALAKTGFFTPPVPRSDGTVEDAGVSVMHFTMQSAFLTDIPSLYQPWDLQHRHLPEYFSKSHRMIRDSTYGAFCRQADTVVVASRWTGRDVCRAYGIEPSSVAVVPVPPPTAAYPTASPTEVRTISSQLGLPDRFLYYPAQTWPHKNHVRLFEGLASLRREGIVVPLVMTGGPNRRTPEVLAVASNLGIADSVHFLGFVSPIQVHVIYQRATALVFPSLFEGWGLPIVEAFEAGIPVACSNATSLPDLVEDAALVFDPRDTGAIAEAIRRLWHDDGLRSELVAGGHRVARRLDWDRTARLLKGLYRRTGGRPLGSDEDELVNGARLE